MGGSLLLFEGLVSSAPIAPEPEEGGGPAQRSDDAHDHKRVGEGPEQGFSFCRKHSAEERDNDQAAKTRKRAVES